MNGHVNSQTSNLDKNRALFNRATRGVKYVAIQNWGYRGVSLIVFVVLARLLTPESIGLVAMSIVYVALLQVFLEQGFVEAIVQSSSTSSSFLDTAFWTNIILAVVLCIGSITASSFIGALFREPDLSPVVCGLAPLLVIRGSASVHIALLRRKMAFKRLAVAALLGVIVGGGAGITLALFDFGVWALVFYQLITRSVEAIVLWIQNPWRPGMEIKSKEFRNLLRFGASVTGSRLVNFLNRYGSDLVIGFFIGPVAVGYYNLSFRLSRALVEMLGGVVSMVSFPLFSRLQDDPETGRQAFGRIIEQLAFISFPLFIGVAICAPQIVEVLFGQKWMPAVPLMRILSIIGMLHTLYYLNTAVFFGFGKPQWRFGLDALNAITNTAVFIIAAQWSVLAVAYGYVIRGYALAPIPLMAIKKLLQMPLLSYIRNISVPLSAGGVMGASLLASRSLVPPAISPLFLLMGQVIVGAVIYLVTVFLISPSLPRRTWRYAFSALGIFKGDTI